MGILVFCIIVAAILADRTNNALKNRYNKNNSIQKKSSHYSDYQGIQRLVKNNHVCSESKMALIDLETKTVVRNYLQESMDRNDNKMLEARNAPGRKKVTITEWIIPTLPAYNDIIWVEQDTGKPYVLIIVDKYIKPGPQEIRYYKCYYISDIIQWHVSNNDHIINCIIGDGYNGIKYLDKKINWDSHIELTKEEFDKWNLDNL